MLATLETTVAEVGHLRNLCISCRCFDVSNNAGLINVFDFFTTFPSLPPFLPSFLHSSLTHPLTHSFTHSFTHSLTESALTDATIDENEYSLRAVLSDRLTLYARIIDVSKFTFNVTTYMSRIRM